MDFFCDLNSTKVMDSNMAEKKRLHFGVILSNLDDTCQYDVWSGIVEFAHRNDIQLTAYVGTYQTTSYDFTPHYETCFELIKNSSSLDGAIVFSGFISSTIGYEDFESYVAGISDHVPLVSVSYVMPDIPSVLVDNISGIYDAVEHLIQVHGKRNIAFVKGPDGHLEAEARFDGYKKALEANGLPYDERYVFPGNFTQHSGQLAVRKLFETPDISADAIVACDDTIAIGVLNELKNHNLMVPTDIAVAGFDDDRDSATFIPSISTARQDFFRIGSISAEVLLDKVNRKPVEPVTYISPVFIVRQSCGCLELTFSDTEQTCYDDYSQPESLSLYIAERFVHFFGKYMMESQINEWAEAFTAVILEKPFSKESFLHLLNEKLIIYSLYSKNVLVWNDVLNALTIGVELHSDEVECTYTILSTLILATSLVQEVRFKDMKIKELNMSDNRVMLRRIASYIVSIFDIGALVEELQKLLPELSIDTAVIGLYRGPIKSNDPDADRTIGHLVGFDGNKKLNYVSNKSDPALFIDHPNIVGFDFETRHDYFLFPLFFKDEEYGVIFLPFDLTIPIEVYETLRVNISTAIKGARLIDEVRSALAQATDASKAKSDFLSAMSHEMRTPMNAIIGMTAIGKKTTEIEEKDYTLNKIEDASSHLLGVINDVLDMAKIEANKLVLSHVEFDFERMLQKVFTVINHRVEEKEQTLTVNIDKKIPRLIISDDQRIMQVLTNLLSNAVKFSPEGGNIHLEATLLGEEDGYCELSVEVIDDGIGISPDQHKSLFLAFEQAETGTSRKYGGTGLGLVISKSIIDLMGGRIWVESEIGKGAKFSFTIKVLCGEENPRLSHASGISFDDEKIKIEAGAFTNKNVLLAEDIEINREIFIALLDEYGLNIECAENGKEALEMVEAAPEKYDIIFMDIQMPVMGGYESTRCIRALPALQGVTLPIIAMTANVFKSDIEDCLAAGMDDHLGKPLDIEKVLQILWNYLLD